VPSRRSLLGIATVVGPLVASAIVTLVPATDTWRGGGGNSDWSNAANWASNTVPGTGDKLVFPASTNLISDDDLSGDTFSGMTFTAAGYDIGGDGFTLSGPLAVTAAVTAGQDEIDPQVTFAAGGRVSVATGGVVLDLAATPMGALVKTGDGTLDAQGLNPDTSPITVRAGILTGCGNGSSSTSPITVDAGASYLTGSPGSPDYLIDCGRPLVVNGTGYQGEGAIDVLQHVNFGALTLGSNATIGGLATDASSSYWVGAVAIRGHTLTSAGFTNTFAGSISGSGAILQDAANITLVEGTGSVRSAVADSGMLGLAVPVTTVTVGGTGVLYTASSISRLSVSASAQLWPCDEPATAPPGPGSPTVTTVAHSLRLPPGTTFVAQLGVGSAAGNDSLTVTSGLMTISGASLVVAAPGACDGFGNATQPGDSYTVLTAPGGLVGTFAGLPDGAVLTGEDGNPYRVTYTATSVVLTRD
jgi:hypothetical protein